MIQLSKVERSSALPVWSIQVEVRNMDVDRRATSNLARDHERSPVSTGILFGLVELIHTMAITNSNDKGIDAVFHGQGRQNKDYALD